MALTSKILRQRCVWWRFKKRDEYGTEEHCPPIEVRCRWTDVKTNGFDSNGTPVVYNSEVMLDFTPGINDRLWKGLAKDLDGVKPRPDSLPILKTEEVPNFKATEIFHFAYL